MLGIVTVKRSGEGYGVNCAGDDTRQMSRDSAPEGEQ